MNTFHSKVIKLIKKIKSAPKLKLILLKNSILLTLNSMSQHSFKFKNPHFLHLQMRSSYPFIW